MNLYPPSNGFCTIEGMATDEPKAGMEIGKRVRAARKGRYSLRQLAMRADMSHNYINMLEKGQVPNPSVGMIQRLADALDVPFSELAAGAVLVEEEEQVITLGAVPELVTFQALLLDKSKSNPQLARRIIRIGLELIADEERNYHEDQRQNAKEIESGSTSRTGQPDS
jgi:transcriptional regulator with XRE-family HTH domain